MDTSLQAEQERSMLMWGGLGGIFGSITFIIVFVIVGVFVGFDVNEPMDFPEIRVARTFEDSLYLLTLILWVPLFLALQRVLREEDLAPALTGTVLGIIGLAILAAGALPHVATLALADLARAPETTPEGQVALQHMWEGLFAVFDALFIVGLIFTTLGVTCLGLAMIKTMNFGKGTGWTSVILGVIGFVGASVLLWNPDSPAAVLAVFALIIFHIAAGWKVYTLSRSR